MRRAMDLIHYVVKDGVMDSAAQLSQGGCLSPGMDFPQAAEVSGALISGEEIEKEDTSYKYSMNFH